MWRIWTAGVSCVGTLSGGVLHPRCSCARQGNEPGAGAWHAVRGVRHPQRSRSEALQTGDSGTLYGGRARARCLRRANCAFRLPRNRRARPSRRSSWCGSPGRADLRGRAGTALEAHLRVAAVVPGGPLGVLGRVPQSGDVLVELGPGVLGLRVGRAPRLEVRAADEPQQFVRSLVYERVTDRSTYAALVRSAESGTRRDDGSVRPPLVVANSMREVQPEINLLVSPDPDRLHHAEPVTAPQWAAQSGAES